MTAGGGTSAARASCSPSREAGQKAGQAAPAPACAEAVDLEHLARMTLGERSLEAEVLTLFHQQAGLLLARMLTAPPPAAAAFAHTLKGSARSIGAWRVAAAAQAMEADCPLDPAQAIERLAAAVSEAQAAIERLLAERS